VFRLTAALLAFVCLPVVLTAQEEVKPRTSTERLPAPNQVTASQIQPSGEIRVVWSAVDGAVRYSLTRSVPPAPAALVPLPDSPDTVYIDRDVKPGSTYYYLIGAINEAGITGLKKSAAPVTAEAPIDTRVPDPPANFQATQSNDVANLTWVGGPIAERFRLDVSTGATTAGTSWVPQVDPRCCFASYSLSHIPTGHHVRFRLRGESATGYVSQPALSNEIVVSRQPTDTVAGPVATDTSTGGGSTNVRPAVVPPAAQLKVAASLDIGNKPFFTSLGLQKVRWVSLDNTKATVDSRGKVLGKAAGLTYVVATGLTQDGAVASVVQRVDVVPK
jgi:hypothetical protein